MTTGWRVLSIDHRDPVAPFEDVVRLIDVAGTATSAAYSRSDVIEALHEHQPAAVAVCAERLVGAAVARVCGADAHLLALALHPQWRNLGIGSALLRELDQGIIHQGAHRLLALVEPGQVGEVAFTHQGFTRLDGLHLYIRAASMVPEELAIVERYGGHFPPPGLWDSMKGFSSTKDLLERRIVAPLAHGDLADRIGLVPPAAVMLFGPPGTGKTSFARCCVATFMVVRRTPSLPPRPGHAGRRLPTSRTRRLAACRASGVLYRRGRRDRLGPHARPDSQPIVNELLKAIPAFKGRPGRLMIMATNSITAIDPAMLRPGRFDLIIPVGAPDLSGRAELAVEFLPAATLRTWPRSPRGLRRRTRAGRPPRCPAGVRTGAVGR